MMIAEKRAESLKEVARSPWENMHVFDAWGIAMLLHHIDDAKVYAAKTCELGRRDERVSDEEIKLRVFPLLVVAQHHAQNAKLQSTYDRVWDDGPFNMASKVGMTYQELQNELTVLRQAVEADLEKHQFLFIPPDKARTLVEMPQRWAEVWRQVPLSIDDTKRAVECYALEQGTACVFHLMRVVEWGLRALCAHLGLTEGPILYSNWEIILNQLPDKIQTKLAEIPKGPEKQKAQEFYDSTLLDVRAIKDAWRNHVMHTRRVCTPGDAAGIMSHVKRIMDALASNEIFKALQEDDVRKGAERELLAP